MAIDRPKIYSTSVFAAKIETTTGTAIALAAADGVYNAFNALIDEDSQSEDRDGQNSASVLEPIPGAQAGKCTLKTEIYGTAAAAWVVDLLVACGFSITGSIVTPLTAQSTTLTMGVYRDGLLKQIAGAQGKVTFDFQMGKVVEANWEFTGKWVAPTDTANITPTFPTTIPPRFQGATVTVGGNPVRISQMSIVVENPITLRPDGGDGTGYRAAIIAGRRMITVKMDPEAQTLATVNYFASREAGTSMVLSAAIGSNAGNIVTFAAPNMFLKNPPKDKNRGNIYAHDLEFTCARNSAAGDDELSITFS